MGGHAFTVEVIVGCISRKAARNTSPHGSTVLSEELHAVEVHNEQHGREFAVKKFEMIAGDPSAHDFGKLRDAFCRLYFQLASSRKYNTGDTSQRGFYDDTIMFFPDAIERSYHCIFVLTLRAWIKQAVQRLKFVLQRITNERLRGIKTSPCRLLCVK